VPIYANIGPGGGYALLDSYRTTLTGLHENEVKALFMMTIPGPMADLGLNQTLQSAVLKLATSSPDRYQAEANFVRQRLHLDAAAWFQTAEAVPLLSVVQKAVWQDRQLQITYRRPSGSVSERLVSPYGLVAKAAVWYLVAATADGMRVYRVSRIETAVLTGDTFTRPATFDLVTYWTEWTADYVATLPQFQVTLKIGPDLLPILPAILGRQAVPSLPPSESDADGWRVVEVAFERKEQACAVVLGMGLSALVIAPHWLRDCVLSSAQGIVARYSG
jgi:predicted DNA-binding transcriptional regulator YafY